MASSPSALEARLGISERAFARLKMLSSISSTSSTVVSSREMGGSKVLPQERRRARASVAREERFVRASVFLRSSACRAMASLRDRVKSAASVLGSAPPQRALQSSSVVFIGLLPFIFCKYIISYFLGIVNGENKLVETSLFSLDENKRLFERLQTF